METNATVATVPATDRRARVLVVDDDALVLRALARVLAADPGLDVRAAAGVDEALALAASWRPDLVLSDVDLGEDRDGFDLALALRGGPAVALMSGHVDEERRGRAAEVGALGIVQKPFAPREAVRDLLDERATRELAARVGEVGAAAARAVEVAGRASAAVDGCLAGLAGEA